MYVVRKRRPITIPERRIGRRPSRSVPLLFGLLCLQFAGSGAAEPEPPSTDGSHEHVAATIESTSEAISAQPLPQWLQVAQRGARTTRKTVAPPGRFKGPHSSNDSSVEPPPILHGIEVGQWTVGLSGTGTKSLALTKVAGGKASALVNATDPVSGRPMLSLLDITGQLTIDVPCVVDRCRVTQVGGLYAVRNSSSLDFEARFCEFEAVMSETGELAAAVILNPRTVRRCIVRGGEDGIKLSSTKGCLIEESWIYGQVKASGTHNDGIQAVKGEGDWDTWVIQRCRIEGPWAESTSALILQADIGNLSGVTVRDCLLSGGTYTLYTRSKNGYIISKIRVMGNVWAGDSWKYGPHSNDCRDLDWHDNWIAPATSQTSPVSVDMNSSRWFLR